MFVEFNAVLTIEAAVVAVDNSRRKMLKFFQRRRARKDEAEYKL